jgi:predicted aconitase with swiveling domain
VKNEPANLVLVMKGGRGLGEVVRASALVSRQGFGVRYDLDPLSGVISNPEHDLSGQSIGGRIVVFTKPKGGVAASWSLADLQERGLAPAGMIFRSASPIFVQGALSAGIPLVDELEGDPCELIQSGDEVVLYPREGRLEVYR